MAWILISCELPMRENREGRRVPDGGTADPLQQTDGTGFRHLKALLLSRENNNNKKSLDLALVGLHICSDLPLRGVGQPPTQRRGAVSSRACGSHTGHRWAGGSPADVGAESAQNGHAVGRHQAPRGGVVGARQVVEVPSVLVLAAPCHLLILLAPYDLALVGDGLHVVLVLMAGLVQRVLPGSGARSAWGQVWPGTAHPTQPRDPQFWIRL